MTEETRTLFVQYGSDEDWDDQTLDHIVESLDGVTDDSVEILLAPDSIEYLDTEELRAFAEKITDHLDDLEQQEDE